MSADAAESERDKRAAGERAVDFVQSGMAVGLGTGSTAIHATRRIGELLRAGRLRDIVGFATSAATESEARRLQIPLLPAELPRELDVTIDGADEVDAALNLIKGGGGALLREKIAAQSSRRVVIVVDESKRSPTLGLKHTLPVEVLRYGLHAHTRFLESLGARAVLRQGTDGTPFVTDEGNVVLDCDFGAIPRPAELAAVLSAHAGIVEHGLFIGLATDLVVAGKEGVAHVKREA